MLARTELIKTNSNLKFAIGFVLVANFLFAQEAPGSFQKWDRNRDGVLSKSELQNFERFDRIDTDKDGVISREEAQVFFRFRESRSRLPDGARVKKDVSYAPEISKSNSRLKLDIYSVKGREDAPVCVYVHGGGWKIGDKSRVHEKARYFLEQGYVFLSVNYRLTPEVEFPAHADDVARALAWTQEHVSKHGGDPNHLILMGHSAGSHLVSFVALNTDMLKASGVVPESIKAVIANDTQVYDIPYYESLRPFGLGKTFSDIFGNEKDGWVAASPITYLGTREHVPAFLLICSSGAAGISHDQRLECAQHFASAIEEHGGFVTVSGFPTYTHEAVNKKLGVTGDPVTLAVNGFLETFSQDSSL